jgi:hypothetical protein
MTTKPKDFPAPFASLSPRDLGSLGSMLRRRLVSFFFGSALVAAASSAAPVEQSISPSRQFIVYGTDLVMRGAICDLAEGTKRELLTVLEQRDDWTTPIVINAQYPQANLPELPRLSVDVGQTGFGLKLQLNLVMNAEVRAPEIRRELLRALLLERIYRGQSNIAAGTAYVSPPDWLLDGIPAEGSDFPRERLASVLALPVSVKTILPLEKFLEQKRDLLDAAGRVLYRAYSLALVDLLSHSPDWPRRIAQFIADLPRAPNDRVAELREHFPEVFGAESAEIRWEKQIVRLSTEQPYQLMGIIETERLLAKKLRLKISEQGVEKDYDLEQLAMILKSKSGRKALNALGQELSALAARANPIYAPIIAEYAEITARVSRGRTLGIERRFERLRTARETLTAQMRQIDDYLNWFEATSVARPSGEFADYMQAAKRAVQPQRTRRDPISIYLDAVEAEFEN